MSEKPAVTNNLPSKTSLILRIIVGGYLVYTAWSLRDSFQTYTGGELAFFIIFSILFAIIGIFLLVVSGYALYRGKYAGGAMNQEEETTEHD